MFPTDLPSDDPWYIRYVHTHPVSEVITGDDDESPYLYRWHMIPRNPIFNIYLHHFVGNDKREMHDHPWLSLAYQLSGTLFEVYTHDAYDNLAPIHSRNIKKGRWTYRGGNFCHTLVGHYNPEDKPIWTIFITGPRYKQWGFITKNGWVYWKKYFGLEKGETNGKEG